MPRFPVFLRSWRMKGVFRPLCLLGAIWLLAAADVTLSAAQVSGRQVEIRVLDQQGLPVAGALVTLSAKQDAANRTAEAPFGAVRIDALAAGVYELRVQAA